MSWTRPHLRTNVPAPGGGADVADLFRARHVDLVRLATLLVGDQATAEDVVQDVFTRVCARAERLAANGIAMSYFRTAVVNACRSVHRRRGVVRRFRGQRRGEAVGRARRVAGDGGPARGGPQAGAKAGCR